MNEWILLTAIMNRCGAGLCGSPEYGKPNGVSISMPIDIKNTPVNIVNTLPGSFINNTNGMMKLNKKLNNNATITAIIISELFPAPERPIIGINKYNAPSIK